MRKIYNFRVILISAMMLLISAGASFAQISLTATAGTPTGTFTTVSDAFAAINAGTHQGDIVISINANTTEPAAPVALAASGVTTTLYTSVLIKPTATVTVSGSPAAGSGVLGFNGSDNITLDGSMTMGGTTRDLTIANTNAITFSNTACIRMIGQTTAGTGLDVNNFTIKNTILIGNSPGNNGTSGSTVTTGYGIYAGSSTATTMSSTGTGANYDNITISNNEIKRAYFGVYIAGGANPNENNNLIIRDNTIGSTVLLDQIGFKGILASQNLNGLIEGNTISNIRTTSSVNAAGIDLGGSASNGVTISKNRVESIYSENTGGWGAYGMNVTAGVNYTFVNNVITDIRTVNYTTSTTYNAFGIRLSSGTGHKVYYNSINIFGNYTTGSSGSANSISADLLVTGTGVTGLDIRNNIFNNKNTSTSTGIKEYVSVWFPSGYNFSNATLNNNYYGILTDANHFVGKIGTTAGSGNYVDLASWQAISQAGNATNDNESEPVSNTVAPFTSDLDLTIPAATVTPIESAGIVIAGLGVPNVDFLNVNRPAPPGIAPDMGAYEFAGFMITCPQPTGLTLDDAGLTSATLSWTVVGSETNWQLQYGAPGFALGTGTIVNTSTNPTTISPLTSNSFYQVYVRGICGPGDTSNWTGPLSFNTYDQGAFIEANTECPASGFIDISAAGTALNTTDDSEAGVTLTFPFLYQGILVSQVTVGNNGGVLLGTLTGNIGYTMAAGNGLYPYVQDLDDPLAGGNVYHQTIGTAPNRQFIVMWDDLPHYFAGTDGATFELIIDEATQEIYYVYDDVMMSNASWTNGADAEIGIRGPQNITLSTNNTTYLTNNTCAHFYYTDCPKPTNFILSYVLPDEAAFSWTAGLAGETNWTVIYGPDGFDPTSSGTTITTTTNSATLPGLSQLTTYDVYIYADCDVTTQSFALTGTFMTLPFCSNPSGLAGADAVDSLFASWTWVESSPVYPATSFNIQYGVFGFDIYTGTEIVADGLNLADTIVDASFMGSGVYQYYVQAVCGADTSSFIGPFTFTMPLSNDTVCGAEMLTVDGTVYVFNNVGATVSAGETIITPLNTGYNTTELPQMGWGQSTLERTTWYTFVAPASGNLRMDGLDLNTTFSQVAVYEVTNCGDFNSFTLVAASDQATGVSTKVATNFTICGLTPGNTYYLMHDSWTSGGTPVTGNFSLKLTPINITAGIDGSVVDVCSGNDVVLFDGISGYDAGGTWSSTVPVVQVSLMDSLFMTNGLAYQTYSLDYAVVDGCANDSSIAQIKVWAPSSAGEDGSINVCRNEPVDLLSGLNGNADLNGTWYNPGWQAIPNSEIVSSNIQGSYNYRYIAGNGVCPDDTSIVLLVVSSSCNYLSVSEMALNEMEIHPNPSTGIFYIDNSFSETFNYEVKDVNGKVIVENETLNQSASTKVDLSSVEPGIYLIHVYNNENKRIFRIVKQ